MKCWGERGVGAKPNPQVQKADYDPHSPSYPLFTPGRLYIGGTPSFLVRGESERWFSEALWDLETAKILHEQRRYNAACFYAHQAAGMAVKSLIISRNESPWGHGIRTLLERYSHISGEDVSSLLPRARELDRHYIPSRYPNAHPQGSPHEAYDEETSNKALRDAEEIVRFVEERLRGR